MGHFLVDDEGSGYDTKADSMLRTRRTGGPNTPKFLLTDEAARPGVDPREELGRMLTADPQFARAAVNMFWAKLMGVGLVDPWDEFDLARLDPGTTPKGWDAQPSNPELLEKLATYFRQNNYSVHKLFRLICDSSAYQLSASFPGEWKEAYSKYYARKFARMLTRRRTARRNCLRHGKTRQVRSRFEERGWLVRRRRGGYRSDGHAGQSASALGRSEKLYGGFRRIEPQCAASRSFALAAAAHHDDAFPCGERSRAGTER